MSPVELRARQARLLRALADAGGQAPLRRLAVDASAAELNAAVTDLVNGELVDLRTDGVLSVGARGSLLDGSRVRAARRGDRYGRRLDLRADVASTNDIALDGADEGPGLAVAAELQVNGRGRRGRSFDSRPGLGLWCSTRVDPPSEPAAAPRLSIVAALAAADAIEGITGRRPGVKWPNDIRLEGKKVCGVLVEARTTGDRLHPVVGIGINVHHRPEDFPAELRAFATSLEAAAGNRVDRSALFAALLDALEAYADRELAGTLDLPAEFAARDDLAGREVEVPEAGRAGVARGIDAEGRLLLEAADGTMHAVRSGDASVRIADAPPRTG